MILSKTYKPKNIEGKIYKLWEKSGFFKANPRSKKKPFSIIMPPPNANGALHIGHAVFVTLEDIMIRYQRMKGREVLWLPGTDHAGIMTQVVYEKKLAKQGKTRFDLGREEFYKQTYKFSMKNKKKVENQLRRLGASCDWSRSKFTLDPKISEAVFYTFKKMYEDGLIFQGKRIINWCPRCQTALSDLEVDYQERKDSLFYIKYGPLTLATVRPETKFGDTAIAVHPDDKRYKKYINKEIKVKTVLGEVKMKVISDKSIDPKFGTGVVKITPAHDPNDFEISKRHKLEIRQVIGFDGKLNEKAGKYSGMKVLEAREKIVKELGEMGLIEKTDSNYKHNVAVCGRCKTTIEPLISEQWFIKAKKLAAPAIKAVRNKKIEFIPKYFKKNYYHWMENIRDWCISRQIWWGHRIPVWYCQCGEKIVAIEKPKFCPKCKSPKLRQDTDTLDTWFSSGQWPFTVFGWPKKTEDFKYFYPTTILETGWDILFFWVARMIMLGIYSTQKIPFRYVYLHGLVRDKEHQKMSKSKGNVIDPLGVIDLYGADALRMALVFGTSPGRDVIISEDKIVSQRKFTNKIWNASRFVLTNKPSQINADLPAQISKKFVAGKLINADKNLTKADKKILKELDKTVKLVTKNLDDFQFHEAAQNSYHFFWHEFCDYYIEESKKQLQVPDIKHPRSKASLLRRRQTLNILLYVLLTSLKLLHPFMPFITEEIYQKLPLENKRKCLMVEPWPSARSAR